MVAVQLRMFPGHKFAISFDGATMLGSDRYLTLTIHQILGNPKVASLGLIRVKQSATGDYLKQLVSAHLENYGLSETDVVAPTFDGIANVLKAVELRGINNTARRVRDRGILSYVLT